MRGLLLATMEPPPTMEEEFQDWYDTEHFPERRPARVSHGRRFVCVDGWPRYLAMYDLADIDVLRGEGYDRIAASAIRRGHIASSRRSAGNTAPRACRCIRATRCTARRVRRHGSCCVASELRRAPAAAPIRDGLARTVCGPAGDRAGAAVPRRSAGWHRLHRHCRIARTPSRQRVRSPHSARRRATSI